MSSIKNTVTHRLSAKGVDPVALYGQYDSRIRTIESEFDAKITARGEDVVITGRVEEVKQIINVLQEMIHTIQQGRVQDVDDIIRAARGGNKDRKGTKSFAGTTIDVLSRREKIQARSSNQQKYVDQVTNCDIVFSIGPAGTGKTYLAVAMAISALRRGEVDRIVLARPAVEAGESLGFLPGDPRDKVDPYLKPLYDALHDMVPNHKAGRLIEDGTIEIIAMAYMRGRTLNNAFVILDEAQNTTIAQMKMFLTRLGTNSKAIITGDITQTDLPDTKVSGLVHVQKVLADIRGIAFVYLTDTDVVRHQLVQDIIKAYEQHDKP